MGDEKSVSKNSWNMEEDFESVDWKSVESYVRGLQISISKAIINDWKYVEQRRARHKAVPVKRD
jgi:hypothetical protein